MQNNIQRIFSPGDKWLYYNIFCGYNSSDHILIEYLSSFSQSMLSQNLIDQWFFIRYNDPSYHIRYRVRMKDQADLGLIINTLNKLLENLVLDEYIWKLQIDTYTREIERYGSSSMEEVEKIFFQDSNMIINIISSLDENQENIRSLFALKLIDFYLSVFNFSIAEKLNFTEKLRNHFYNEFNIDKNAKKQFDKLYSENKHKIDDFLSKKTKKINKKLIAERALKILELRDRKLLNVDFYSLISSLIHMSLNRLFVGDNRMHELITYDFIWRFYKKEHYFSTCTKDHEN
ncbi:thiopeptide-type bacteriocin biosynthesis protein [Chryseobacterium sp. OSA05B]|uniref:thiopeptide-type bacteriocin biosynthesis protein n=1 Tax=Chryseobacterium sp. OSA05B TaxID=2862650 RepID=UPI001CC103C7|nr:thiopeptide-type bacteriocin biosynthesis protein [Chryseobacterium sp. OSA05B]